MIHRVLEDLATVSTIDFEDSSGDATYEQGQWTRHLYN